MAQHSAQQVVTISKDVSLNHDLLADGALNGKTASIDGWLYPLDNHSSPLGVRVHTASSLCTLLSKRHAKCDREDSGERWPTHVSHP